MFIRMNNIVSDIPGQIDKRYLKKKGLFQNS